MKVHNQLEIKQACSSGGNSDVKHYEHVFYVLISVNREGKISDSRLGRNFAYATESITRPTLVVRVVKALASRGYGPGSIPGVAT